MIINFRCRHPLFMLVITYYVFCLYCIYDNIIMITILDVDIYPIHRVCALIIFNKIQ